MNANAGVVLTLCWLLSLPSSGSVAGTEKVTLAIQSVQAISGQEVDVGVQALGCSDVGAMHLELAYDSSVLAAKDVAKGPLLSNNSLLEFNARQPGRMIIGLVSLGGVEGDGQLLTVKFLVHGPAGTDSPLNLENASAWQRTSHLDEIVVPQSGKLVVGNAPYTGFMPPLYVALLLAAALLVVLVPRKLRRLVEERPATPRSIACGARAGDD